MGTLYLVRHGQASFGADNYDNLSRRGIQQSRRLGEYFAQKGIRFEAAVTGTLKRQVQTHAGICEGTRIDLPAVACDGLTQWMNGVVSPRGMPSYTDFAAGVSAELDHACKNFEGNVLLVSSGGPSATAGGQALGTTPETTIEMNLHIRNSAVTEFVFNPKRYSLLTYNTLPHLDAAEYADWVTYA